jgi:hypothetical protein
LEDVHCCDVIQRPCLESSDDGYMISGSASSLIETIEVGSDIASAS